MSLCIRETQLVFLTMFVLCLIVAAQAAAAATDADKNRPVTKVINLLKDMQATLAKEADEDESVYEKVRLYSKMSFPFIAHPK